MNIEFIPGSKEIEELIPHPISSKLLIPEWYKKLGNYNIKKCVPFLDSIIHGYIQTTWCDIHVKKNNNKVILSQNHSIDNFGYRSETSIELTDNFYTTEFVWKRPWSIKLPKEFSGLITHPLNRLDLPFITSSGIIDFDEYCHTKIGNIPFFIKKDFEGVITKGTPMFQIIPIKRENWKSFKNSYDEELWNNNLKERGEVSRFYKKKIWKKKTFY